MKVLGSVKQNSFLVEIDADELCNLAGFDYDSEFEKAFGCKLDSYYTHETKALVAVENIPVGAIYSEAKETLSAYEDLRTKFESIRNQLTTLMKKMVLAKPAPKEEKK